MFVDKVRRRIGNGGRETTAGASYCFDVEESHRHACQALIRRNGLSARFYTDTDGRVETDGINGLSYMVYDVSKYSFKEILEKISSGEYPGTTVAFYNPDNQSVITESNLFV